MSTFLVSTFPASKSNPSNTQQLASILGNDPNSISLSTKVKSGGANEDLYFNYLQVIKDKGDLAVATEYTNPFTKKRLIKNETVFGEIAFTVYNFICLLINKTSSMTVSTQDDLQQIKPIICDLNSLSEDISFCSKNLKKHALFTEGFSSFIENFINFMNAQLLYQMAVLKKNEASILKSGGTVLGQLSNCKRALSNLEPDVQQYFNPQIHALNQYFNANLYYIAALGQKKALSYGKAISSLRAASRILKTPASGSRRKLISKSQEDILPVLKTEKDNLEHIIDSMIKTEEDDNRRIYSQVIPDDPPDLPNAFRLNLFDPTTELLLFNVAIPGAQEERYKMPQSKPSKAPNHAKSAPVNSGLSPQGSNGSFNGNPGYQYGQFPQHGVSGVHSNSSSPLTSQVPSQNFGQQGFMPLQQNLSQGSFGGGPPVFTPTAQINHNPGGGSPVFNQLQPSGSQGSFGGGPPVFTPTVPTSSQGSFGGPPAYNPTQQMYHQGSTGGFPQYNPNQQAGGVPVFTPTQGYFQQPGGAPSFNQSQRPPSSHQPQKIQPPSGADIFGQSQRPPASGYPAFTPTHQPPASAHPVFTPINQPPSFGAPPASQGGSTNGPPVFTPTSQPPQQGSSGTPLVFTPTNQPPHKGSSGGPPVFTPTNQPPSFGGPSSQSGSNSGPPVFTPVNQPPQKGSSGGPPVFTPANQPPQKGSSGGPPVFTPANQPPQKGSSGGPPVFTPTNQPPVFTPPSSQDGFNAAEPPVYTPPPNQGGSNGGPPVFQPANPSQQGSAGGPPVYTPLDQLPDEKIFPRIADLKNLKQDVAMKIVDMSGSANPEINNMVNMYAQQLNEASQSDLQIDEMIKQYKQPGHSGINSQFIETAIDGAIGFYTSLNEQLDKVRSHM